MPVGAGTRSPRREPQGTAMPAPTAHPVERGAPATPLQAGRIHGGVSFVVLGRTASSLVRCTVLYLKLACTEGTSYVSDEVLLFLLVPYLAHLSIVL